MGPREQKMKPLLEEKIATIGMRLGGQQETRNALFHFRRTAPKNEI